MPSPTMTTTHKMLDSIQGFHGKILARLFKEDWEAAMVVLEELKPYRARFLIGIFFGVLYSVVNGTVPLLVQKVMGEIFGGAVSQADILQASTTTGPQGASSLESVLWVCMAIPAMMAIRSLFTYLNVYQMSWVTTRVLCDIRRKLFAHLLTQSLDFFNRSRSGELISRIANDTRIAQSALTTVSTDLVKHPLTIIVAVAVLVRIDWVFTLCTLVVFPVCLLPMILYGRKVRKAGHAEEQDMGNMIIVLQETLAGMRVIKSFAREPHELSRFQDANEAQFSNTMRVRRATEVVGPLVEVVAAVGVGLALLYVYYKQLNAGTFFALMAGIFLLYEPIKKLSRLHLVAQKCLATLNNLLAIMRLQPAVAEKPNAPAFTIQSGAISFEQISFSYTEDNPAVSDVQLTIPAGSTVALVGESGAGKSTMFSLLLRFFDPSSGRILVDGQDLRDLRLHDLRSGIGVVTQDTFLFHDTIEYNIRYGKMDATREEVEEAAKLAFAHDFIMQQTNGYDTVIGDKGCMLSGGQQQRVAIARALLKNAPILLLDEATSALDSQSERMIQAALERLATGRTVLAIAHRLSTVLSSDIIVVMDRGRIAATGTHTELLAKSELYQNLYRLQFHNSDTK